MTEIRDHKHIFNKILHLTLIGIQGGTIQTS